MAIFGKHRMHSNKIIIFLKSFFNVLKHAGRKFVDDNAFKLAASLSYYTTFSLAPFLTIIISIAGIFFGKAATEGKIYQQISSLVGKDAALQIQEVIQNISQSQHTTAGTVIGIVTLFFGATTVFNDIHDSINYICSIKARPKHGWLQFIVNRVVSFSLIVSAGFLLIVTLSVNALMTLLKDHLDTILSEDLISFYSLLNTALLLAIIVFLFAVLFKVLPDVIIRWRDAVIGAVFSSVLFLFGKFLIGFYIGNSHLGSTYGTIASIIIILVWVYYSSVILYYGAEFTVCYATMVGHGIQPKRDAIFIEKKELKKATGETEVETDSRTLR